MKDARFVNGDGEWKSVRPERIENAIGAAKPAVVSVRCFDGSEATITDVCIDVRYNGIHILLDCPEVALIDV